VFFVRVLCIRNLFERETDRGRGSNVIRVLWLAISAPQLKIVNNKINPHYTTHFQPPISPLHHHFSFHAICLVAFGYDFNWSLKNAVFYTLIIWAILVTILIDDTYNMQGGYEWSPFLIRQYAYILIPHTAAMESRCAMTSLATSPYLTISSFFFHLSWFHLSSRPSPAALEFRLSTLLYLQPNLWTRSNSMTPVYIRTSSCV
jgi:hypothetical protein